jgi:hypothetical protein
MNVGERYSLAWKHPHRLEATIIALEADHVVCKVDHRCSFACYLAGMKNTLPIEGRLPFTYHDFDKLFLPLNADAIALPA